GHHRGESTDACVGGFASSPDGTAVDGLVPPVSWDQVALEEWNRVPDLGREAGPQPCRGSRPAPWGQRGAARLPRWWAPVRYHVGGNRPLAPSGPGRVRCRQGGRSPSDSRVPAVFYNDDRGTHYRIVS